MSETLEQADKLGKAILEKAPDIIDKLTDFSVMTSDKLIKFIETEAPNLFQEIVMVGRFQSAIAVVGFAIIIIALCKFGKYLVKSSYNPNLDTSDSEGLFAIGILTYVIALFAGIILLAFVYDNITPWVAPRMYVLEYLISLKK